MADLSTQLIALHVPEHGYCVEHDWDRNIDQDGNNPDCVHEISYCRECDHRWPCRTYNLAEAAS